MLSAKAVLSVATAVMLLGRLGLLFVPLAAVTCQAQTPGLRITQITPVASTTIRSGGGVVTVNWSGGTAPFQVQCLGGLAGTWQDVDGITFGFGQTNVLTEPTALYRVVSVAATIASSPDKTAPSVPAGLSVWAAGSDQVNLAWTASADTGSGATGVKGYNVYRNGVFLKQVLAPATTTSDIGLLPSTTNVYTVSAVDNAYNQSARSSPASASTSANGSCNYGLSTTSASFAFSGGDASVGVTATGGCGWTAMSDVSWITINSCEGISGNGTVSYTVAANTATSSRPGTMTIAGQTFTISQAAAEDTNSPTVFLTAPTSGSTVSGTITLSATASDNVGVSKVEFYCDGTTLVGTATAAPYSMSYNSTGLANGSHSFCAKAYDAAGNSTTSAGSPMTVNNGTTPPGGQLQWLQTTLPQYMARVNGVATDHSGNVIAVGYFYTSVDFGSGLITAAGYYDAFVAKYTPQGTLTWVKRIGGTGFDAAYGVAIDSQNNIIVVGTFQGSADFGAGPVSATGGSTDQDAFVAKYSPGSAGVPGTLIWVRTWGGYPNDFAHAVAVDGSDNIIATSESSGTVYFGNGFTKTGHGSTDVGLVKFQGVTAGPTLAGTTLWAQMYGGTYNDVGYGLAVDRNGDVAVTGYFNYGGVSGGNLGGTPFSGSASAGAFVAKYSGLDGGYRWSWVLGGTAGYGIAVDPGTANVFATGQGSSGLFVNAYDLSGTPLWAKTYGNSGDAGRAIAVDGGGNVALTGNCGSVDWKGNWTYSNGTGFFVSSLTTAGSFRWAVQGNNQSYGCGVAFDSLGHVLSGGYFYFTVDFGGISASALGGAYNAFVAQYSK